MQGDETIENVVQSLERPDEYIRLVLGNMMSFRRRSIEPVVRIGITGEGKAPYYRLEPAPKADGASDDLDAHFEDFQDYLDHVKAFNGRSHKDMNWGALQLKSGHWSAKAMSFAEVQVLLGSIRSLKKKR